jgi:type IV secretion system protein VirB9
VRILALALALLAAPLAAEVVPTPGMADPRIQSVAYDPGEVVALRLAAGYAVTVRFSPDERIETVTLGDSASWQAQVNRRADALIIKPGAMALPTNLTVLTDQRSYSFALYEDAMARQFQPFVLNFTYPNLGPAAPGTSADASQYDLRGERSLWPISISEDGSFTSLRWSDEATLPAVYREDERGELALVNGVMREGVYVIEGVPQRLVFVLGRARATATRVEGSAAP